ncbi:hypothetical protein PRIPAC_78252 [Pristionchus pacificus]|uniref:Uncharacterized protein n=1 Tax=Pristionchus pacificus TaxID=54126 RepID=A0A2A6CQ60_PRIPA|nr:hypothetical protein PRIPAC_78252 [Pristionchus pacificus]|eukprot:PDM80355.1 hypothetical protein PRIPAC_32934 [Pristionchus pacificus]
MKYLHSSIFVSFFLLISLQHVLASKEENEQCQVELEAKHKAESDKNLSDTLTKIDDAYKGAIAIVQGMNAAQKDKLASKYFVGVCEPIRDLYEL